MRDESSAASSIPEHGSPHACSADFPIRAKFEGVRKGPLIRSFPFPVDVASWTDTFDLYNNLFPCGPNELGVRCKRTTGAGLSFEHFLPYGGRRPHRLAVAMITPMTHQHIGQLVATGFSAHPGRRSGKSTDQSVCDLFACTIQCILWLTFQGPSRGILPSVPLPAGVPRVHATTEDSRRYDNKGTLHLALPASFSRPQWRFRIGSHEGPPYQRRLRFAQTGGQGQGLAGKRARRFCLCPPPVPAGTFSSGPLFQ